MEPSEPQRLSLPPHHHHHQSQQPNHQHHHVILCPHHHHHHHHHHMMRCPNHHHHHLLLNSSFSQNPEARGALREDNQFQSEPAAVVGEAPPSGWSMLEDGDDGVEEAAEEEEDPIFVLTDEWREYFAKSEAKRRLAKKRAKKDRK